VARRLVKEAIKEAGVRYRVKPFTKADPERWREHCGGRPHIGRKCSGKPMCGYGSGPRRTSDHKCKVVGCTAKQAALCLLTQEKCLNCRGNHIVFCSRCAQTTEVTRAAREKRRTEPTERIKKAGGAATWGNRITLGRWAKAL